MICEIDGRMLGGMQFEMLFEVLVAVRAHFCEIDGRVLAHVVWVLGLGPFWGAVWGVV